MDAHRIWVTIACAMSMYNESLRAFLKPVLMYLDDDSVSEIMINGPEDIWIERKVKRDQDRRPASRRRRPVGRGEKHGSVRRGRQLSEKRRAARRAVARQQPHSTW